jgi:phosphohistidine swiveling domain-containing protein
MNEFLSKLELVAREVGDETVVFSQSENSDLLPLVKPCAREFFQRVFSKAGPFWRAYSDLRLGIPLENYLSIAASRLFFCRNVELNGIRSVGPLKKPRLKEGSVVEEIDFSPGNLLLFLSAPFDAAGLSVAKTLATLKAKESLAEFEELSAQVKDFVNESEENFCENLDFEKLFILSSECMRNSFVASLCKSLGAKLPESKAWRYCEAQELRDEFLKNPETAGTLFGFHSTNPYDPSQPRYSEKLPKLVPEPPLDSFERWRENCKFLCSRLISLERKFLLRKSESTGLGDLVFFLEASDLKLLETDSEKARDLASERKKEFERDSGIELPRTLVYSNGSWQKLEVKAGVKGIPAGSPARVTGVLAWVDSDSDYLKELGGKIIACKTLSPNLAALCGKAIGIISLGGGTLAHTAIVAREKGLPCVVQARNLESLVEGSEIILDGKTGEAITLKTS